MPLPFSIMNSQQLQQQVLLMLIPMVLMPLLSNEANHDTRYSTIKN